MFAILIENINPIAPVGTESVGVGILSVIVALALMMFVMLLMIAAVVWVGIWISGTHKRGSSETTLKQTIAEQQRQIDDIKRELEEMKGQQP